MDELPPFVQTALDYVLKIWEFALGWLQSPQAWSQFGVLVVAYLLARILTRRMNPALTRRLTPDPDQDHILNKPRLFLLIFLPLLLPLLAYLFTAVGEAVTRSIFGSGAVIALGKRVFLFLAARVLVRDIISDGFLKTYGKFVFLPIMALYALGLLGLAQEILTDTMVQLGNIQFSLMAVVRGIVAGGLIFWLGSWSNQQSTAYLGKQEDLRPSLRELATKAVEFAIFGFAFLLLMNIMGINLSTLAVLGGAIGVGLGFGLQKIASNFISGVILLLEGQATVGDYVELDGGEAGTIVKMMARAAILETYDGRWIVVPNEDFITTRVVNYSDSGSANRYEADFFVSYDTDINLIPDIVEKAVAKHAEVLDKPFPPDCELRGFGENGVNFAVEFWVNGIDDGKNKFTSDVLFLIWNALHAHNIEIPFPQRVVHMKHDSE